MKAKTVSMPAKFPLTVHLTTRDIASVSVFATLYVVLGFIPLFYIFGAYGQFITAALILAPITGIVLGPVGGTLAIAIGGIAGMAITGNMPMGPFSFLPGTLDALCVGLAFRGRWYASAAIFAVFILAFAALPSIGAAKYFVWFHAFALLILLSPASTVAREYLKNDDPQKVVMGAGILVFIGVLIDHIVGSFFFQILTPLPPSVWEMVAFIYPIERVLVTIVATIIGAGIIKGITAWGFKIGETLA